MPLTNSQYNTLMRIYEEKQVRSRDRLNLHFERVYEAVPKIKSLDDSISYYSVQQARKLLSGDESALPALKKQLHELSQRRAQLLVENGFPADYLEATYECPDCKDTGYIGNQKCHCFLKSIIDLFYTQSNLKGILEHENFDTFSFDYYSKNYIDRLSGQTSRALAEKAYFECMNFIRNFDTAHENLLLFGTTGIGKTFLNSWFHNETVHNNLNIMLNVLIQLDLF